MKKLSDLIAQTKKYESTSRLINLLKDNYGFKRSALIYLYAGNILNIANHNLYVANTGICYVVELINGEWVVKSKISRDNLLDLLDFANKEYSNDFKMLIEIAALNYTSVAV